MLVMSVVKEHYTSITVKARRLIKKKCIHVCTFEGLKKKKDDLSCLKRNVIFLYEWCGPKELINLASPLATLKFREDSKSSKRLLAQVILKANRVSGFFCLQTVSCCFDRILRKGLAHSMLHAQVNISAPGRWVFHSMHCLAMFSTVCIHTRLFSSGISFFSLLL